MITHCGCEKAVKRTVITTGIRNSHLPESLGKRHGDGGAYWLVFILALPEKIREFGSRIVGLAGGGKTYKTSFKKERVRQLSARKKRNGQGRNSAVTQTT